jgi:sterol desaturase/sphingolipid hydroxylase (fatty acid hydroxylase superfamily)
MAAKPTTTRMFESDFIEKFSRVHPATPFVAYVPLLAWVLHRSFVRPDAPTPVVIAGLVAAGTLTWTLTEYLLHRFVFHWVNDTTWGKRIHFLLHGVHHDFPNDKDRLVMPLGASIPMAIIFYVLFRGLFGIAVGEPLYVGMGIGYLLYDGTHYAVHHFKQRTRLGKWIRKHHMVHHFADHEGGFGVSSPLWDIVFRTMPVKKSS